jgi:TatD DNase family protein
MLDSHCHLDRFQNPESVAAQAAGRGVFIVAMTNLPSHFEIGLDFSRHGKATAERQVESFRRVIRLVAGKRKFLSLHSRGDETTVLGLLREYSITGAVLHWCTGSLRTLDEILEAGHFLSVNPAMVFAESGRALIRRIPRDRLLTETDAPHVLVNKAPALPWHVGLVEEFVAQEWGSSQAGVSRQVWSNFTNIVNQSLPTT